MNPHDTVVAISTPIGHGGLGVIRISGNRATEIAQRILRFPSTGDWQPWSARLAELVDDDGGTVDQVVVSFFAAPRSYTAEDVVEISCHGSPVVLRYCVEKACAAGARLAEPGEFTFRAFLNGRIDLPQAEAVRDLIESTTLYQARVASQQVDGSVSRRLAPVKTQLLELIALLEAGIDFAEDDISVAPEHEILRRLEPIREAIARLIDSFRYGKLVHAGLTLAIIGRPNAGKSSLFNRLLRQDRAIVTEIPGTTRDAISETASLGGVPVRFVDTAGVREGQDMIEALGIERTWQALADADLTLVVVDLSDSTSPEDRQLIERARNSGPAFIVGNKSDLPRRADRLEDIAVSALTGQGVEELRERLLDAICPAGVDRAEPGFITSLRQEQLLRESAEALASAVRATESAVPHEMLLLDLYDSLRPIDAITGATTADDILNRIFSTFCIGK